LHVLSPSFWTRTGKQQIRPLRRFRLHDMALIEMARCGFSPARIGPVETAGSDDFHSSRSRCGRIQNDQPISWPAMLGKIYINDSFVICVNKNNLHRNVSFAIALLMSHECGWARYPLFQSRLLRLHLLGDIVWLISAAHYISSKWF
jgi:hypothetical protein